MFVFSNKNNSIKELKETPFRLEKDLQNFVEENIEEILDLTLIKSEFVLKDSRFDSIAWDNNSNSFVIIEYKRNRNYSVIDQGMTYLGLLLDNRAEFVLAYQEKFNKPLSKNKVNWEDTKVIFISNAFTDFQMSATFEDLPIELCEIKKYADDIIIVNPIKKRNTNGIGKVLSKDDKKISNIVKEIKSYTEEEHLRKANPEIRELYENIKYALCSMDSQIEIEPKKLYIAFKKRSNICDLEIQKNNLKIFINAKKGTINDSKHIFKDVSDIGHWGNGDYQIVISNDKELEYILSVIKQIL